jgi:hypothetical protein
MKKQDFIRTMQNDILDCEALIDFTKTFDIYVMKYDGKVYNRKMFDDFNNAKHTWDSGEDYHCICFAHKEGERGDNPTHLEIHRTTADGTWTSDTATCFYYGQRHGESLVVDRRVSYKAFEYQRDKAIESLQQRINEKKEALLHIDEYEALHNEIVTLVNDFQNVCPRYLGGLTPLTYTYVHPLFSEY